MNTPYTINTANLREHDTTELRGYAKLLDTYVSTRPSHMFGLCYWLRHQEGNFNGYDFIADVTTITPPYEDGSRSYLSGGDGPTDIRVGFAGAIAWAIAAELKRREPKEPRKPTINLKKASLQRIFEFGLRHGRKQGKRCVTEAGACAMRGLNGTACIVGSMIDDELASLCDNACIGAGPSTDTPEWAELIGKGRKAEQKAYLLREMQHAHDSASDSFFLGDFERSMLKVASDFGLTYKEPGVTLRA
jgi:hypothetical protein